MKRLIFKPLLLAALCCSSALAAEIDWGAAASRDVTFFNAGTASWEAVLIKDTHDGANGVRKRKACVNCHLGEEAEMTGNLSGDSSHQFYASSERNMVNGTLQMMVAGSDIHFRIGLPGVANGQVSVLLDNGAFESSPLSGCWASCHADARGMPHDSGADLTKYLSRSRTKNSKTGGGDSYKSEAELAQLLDTGEFLELMAVRFSADSVSGHRGYILEARHQAESASLKASASNGFVSFSRPLAAAGIGEKAFLPEAVYTLGLSLHIGDAEGRQHLVSFPVNFSIGAQNDIQFISDSKDED